MRDILKKRTILARIVSVSSILAGEYHENEIRKDFTPSERVAIARAIERQIGNRRGQRTDTERVQFFCRRAALICESRLKETDSQREEKRR